MLLCISSLCPLGALSQGFGSVGTHSTDTHVCTHILLISQPPEGSWPSPSCGPAPRNSKVRVTGSLLDWLHCERHKTKATLGQGSEGGSSRSHRAGFAWLGVGDGFTGQFWRLALRVVLLCGAHSGHWGRGRGEFCNTRKSGMEMASVQGWGCAIWQPPNPCLGLCVHPSVPSP